MENRIVCVDDQMGVRCLLKEMLKEDYDVKAVGSGREAIQVFDGFNPQLVILDMYLGDMKGTEVLSHIRQSVSNPNAKVVVMSGLMETDIKEQLDFLKPEYILKKPFDVEKLKSKIRSIMGETLDIKLCS